MNIGEQLTNLAGVDIYIDRTLVFAGVSLMVIGYLMVSSASLHLGARLTGNLFHYPVRQLIHITLGLMAGFFVYMIPMAVWEKAGVARAGDVHQARLVRRLVHDAHGARSRRRVPDYARQGRFPYWCQLAETLSLGRRR